MTLIVTATDLPRLLACNGSRLMGGFIPPVEADTTVRDEGNAAHWLVEQVHNRKFANVEELIDRKAPNGVYITAEMVEHLEQYLKDVGVVGQGTMIEPNTSYNQPTWSVHGRADALTYDAARAWLTVRDLKYGWSIVEPENNFTMISHAVGFMVNNPTLPIAGVTFMVYQPRPYHPNGPVRSVSITSTELQQASVYINESLSNPSDTLNTGAHCYRCPALAICPAARKAQMNAIDASEKAFVDEIDNVNLSFQLDHLSRAITVLQQMQKAYEELALHRVKSGQIIENYGVENGLTNRQWQDHVTEGFIASVSDVDVSKRQLISPKQAESKGVSKELVAALTERKPKAPKLVRVDAHKKAAKVFGTTLALMLCVFLSACGTVTVTGDQHRKQIALTNFTAAPGTDEIRGIMETSAFHECPDGYTTHNQKFDKPNRVLVWEIECN